MEGTAQRRELLNGVRAALPLLLGVAPFGLVFGLLARQAGLSTLAALAMSAIVFAGSAQFVAVGLIAQGVAFPLIVVSTLVLNLRHMLYGASLAPYWRALPQRLQALMAFALTDEAYAISFGRYTAADTSPHKAWFYGGAAGGFYIIWLASTVAGALLGQAIPDPMAWGLDFALPVTFIGLLAPFIRNRAGLAAAVVAGVVALATGSLPGRVGILLAALAGVAAGLVMERWTSTPSS